VTRVLVVEDQQPMLRALAMNLTARGYTVTEAANGTDALTAIANADHDVVILDLGLPDISGFEVITGIRRYATIPIVVLSARTGSSDKVQALDLGADDYVSKPFNMDELLARLRALVRRGPVAEDPATITIGNATIDLAMTSAVDREGVPIHLTRTEWKMLETLLRQPGRLVTSETLLTALRGAPDYTDPSYLRIYMAALRKKLEIEPSRPRNLVTEPGMGYRFVP
jgi:two-component system KDP operon response regulator KdpE